MKIIKGGIVAYRQNGFGSVLEKPVIRGDKIRIVTPDRDHWYTIMDGDAMWSEDGFTHNNDIVRVR